MTFVIGGMISFLDARSNPRTGFIGPDTVFRFFFFKNKVPVFKNWEISPKCPDFRLLSKN